MIEWEGLFEDPEPGLSRVHVIATSAACTRRALAVAIGLTADSRTATVEVEPMIPRAMTSSRLNRWTRASAARYQKMVRDLGARTHVEVHACRSFDDLLQVIPPGETIVMGGSCDPRAVRAEEQLAGQLSHVGRRCVWVAVLAIDRPAATRRIARDVPAGST